MWQTLVNFASGQDLALTQTQAEKLVQYANLVWQKKDFLNLTSAADLQEVLTRHICDGLQGAAYLLKNGSEKASILDAGAGAGYIGLTLALALPNAQVTLVESIEKRCAFMNWAILQLGLKNACVQNMRLGEKPLRADVVTERAMGQLGDILGICLDAVKPGGKFVAYQGENSPAAKLPAEKYGAKYAQAQAYQLPCDTKTRYLVCFEKGKND